MRIIFGSPPVAPEMPAVEGWRQIPALGAKRIQTYGLVTGCAGLLLVSVFLRGAISPSSLWMAAIIMLGALPLHELLHAITTPAWGLSDLTIIGFQRGSGLLLPYMLYEGSQPLWRMLLTGLAPITLMTVLPVIMILSMPLPAAVRADLGFLAVFNAATSGGDLVNFYWLISHLSIRATVKGNGWGLLWKN